MISKQSSRRPTVAMQEGEICATGATMLRIAADSANDDVKGYRKYGRCRGTKSTTAVLPRKRQSPFARITTVATIMLLSFSSRVSGFSTTPGIDAGARHGCRRPGHGWRRCPVHSTSQSKAIAPRACRANTMMTAAEGSMSSSISMPSQPPSQAAAAAAATTETSPKAVPIGVGSSVDSRVTAAANVVTTAAATVVDQKAQRVRVAVFFFFWYTFNVGYNLCTKFTLNVLPLPLMLAAVQLLVGVPYVWTLWLTGIRKRPSLSPAKLRGTVPVATAHTMAHVAAVVSIGAGAVGFVQVVKGAEPLFTSLLSMLTGSAMPWPVYLTLLPVIGGVAMASAGEISFSILAFSAAMTSNASAASRSVLGKMYMAKEKEDGGTMDAGNLYAIMTMLGCLVLTPIALAMEGPKVAGIWNAALSAGYRPHNLIKTGLMSGLFFYLYNEVSFYALNIIHPVTHALGNTLKRVVMIIVSVLVLNHKFTPLGLVGCSTAICGVMGYSLTKAKLESGKSAEGDVGDAGDSSKAGLEKIATPTETATAES